MQYRFTVLELPATRFQLKTMKGLEIIVGVQIQALFEDNFLSFQTINYFEIYKHSKLKHCLRMGVMIKSYK